MPRTFDDAALAIVRRAYAKQMLAVAGVSDDPRVEAAFAAVPRERHLGPPPWRMVPIGGHRTPSVADPVLAYQDVLFALDPERGVNNGSPSLHASWLHHADLRLGERVVHLGAGTGYYTALIAHLVGESGRVVAVEYDGRLAEEARNNLAHLRNVRVVQGDGAHWPEDGTDCIYVNFAVERPAPAWIERLNPGGRLLFPLGVPRRSGNPRAGRHALHGAALRAERRGEGFAVRWLGPAFFVCAEGGEGVVTGSDAERAALHRAFEGGGVEFVRSLHWRRPVRPERCWFTGADWALCYDEAS